ncbi:DUF6044 family protein [candidate division CSSED10-310 bacterium]|uniref:DUF6044 family protein n=1 Tax=candidate division CSSED10-310 bacterium TaxID=2855610 RepID=A0ABV6YRR2_UNCC1
MKQDKGVLIEGWPFFLGVALFLIAVSFSDLGDMLWIKFNNLIFIKFERFYRYQIAYLFTILSCFGLVYFLFRRFTSQKHREKWLAAGHFLLKKIVSFYQRYQWQSVLILVVLCGLGFRFLDFPVAFVFTTLVGAVLFFTFRQSERKFIIFSLCLLFLYWSPFLFWGQEVHDKIFDNLDCHIPHTKVLAESGKAFSLNPETRLDNFVNGLPLSGLDSGYNVLTWLFMVLPPFVAYVLHLLVMRLVAFWGMLLFLKTWVFPDQDNRWIIAGVALCFALLPFYPAGGLSIAGLPLLLLAFFNLRASPVSRWNYLYIVVYPFYSKLALSGFFIVLVLFGLFLSDWFRSKRFSLPFFLGLATITLAYIFTHFHLVYSLLNPDFVSFREELRTGVSDTATCFKNTLHNIALDRVNVVGTQQVFILGSTVLALFLMAFRKIKNRWLVNLLLVVFSTSLLWGFKYWIWLSVIREKVQLLNAFDFSRFFWFNPFLWQVIFALSLMTITKIRYGHVLAAIFIIGQIFFLFSTYHPEYRLLLGKKNTLKHSLTYKEFYSESLFEKIAHHIGKSKETYRVISLGLHPGISQYNGFYTLDIYADIYPLEYKHKFREIMIREIEKNKSNGFDKNAKRCYLMSSELHSNHRIRSMMYSRGLTKQDQRIKIKNLELNTKVLKEMGGEYILSAVEILNFEENRLIFEGKFEDAASPWLIYLYRVP